MTVSAPAPSASRPDGDHPLAVDEDVGPDGRRAGAVDHRPAADGDCHALTSSPVRPAGRCRWPAGRDRRRTRTRWRAKACMPSGPSSTPKPDCFHPPIGAYMSMAEMPWALTKTVPADEPRGHVGRQRVVVAPDRRAQPEGRCRSPRRPPRRCRRRGSPAGPGRTAPRARCRDPRRWRHHEGRRDEVAPRPLVLGPHAAGPRTAARRRSRLGEHGLDPVAGARRVHRAHRHLFGQAVAHHLAEPAARPARPPSRPAGPGARRAA